MITMLPFTTTDLTVAVVVVGLLVALSLVVYLLARVQAPASRTVVTISVEAEPAMSPAQTGTGAIQHA